MPTIDNLKQEVVKHLKYGELLRFFALPQFYDKVNYLDHVLRRIGEIPGIDKKVDKHLHKNDADAENFRKEGNTYFSLKNKDYFKAIELYNKSICFAPTGSENLAIGYANRSAIFFEWKKYEECLESIKNARLSNYPENLRHKLDKREIQCLEAMRNMPEESEENVVFELSHERHPQVPFISKCLDIKNDEKLGRYIYTKEELVPGQLVAIEEPFCSVLLPPFKYIRCANCNIENNYNLIPCPNCTSAMFCSEKCMEEGHNSFHRYECPVIDALYEVFHDTQLTGLRITLVALQCFDNAQEMMKFCNAPENQNKDAFSINYKNFNKKEYYRAIQGLVSHQEKASNDEVFELACLCAVLKYYMLNDTPLREIFNTEENTVFFTNLLHKYLRISNYNNFGVHFIQPKGRINRNFSYCALGMYGFGSLLNHSCIPNVFRVNKNTKSYLFVLRPIPKNGILYDNYGYDFVYNSREVRQEESLTGYKFICECEACVYDYSQEDAYKQDPKLLLPVSENDHKMLLLCNKKTARENYKSLIAFLRQNGEHSLCYQKTVAEDCLKMSLNILLDTMPLCHKI